jgi:hypothetical protein
MGAPRPGIRRASGGRGAVRRSRRRTRGRAARLGTVERGPTDTRAGPGRSLVRGPGGTAPGRSRWPAGVRRRPRAPARAAPAASRRWRRGRRPRRRRRGEERRARLAEAVDRRGERATPRVRCHGRLGVVHVLPFLDRGSWPFPRSLAMASCGPTDHAGSERSAARAGPAASPRRRDPRPRPRLRQPWRVGQKVPDRLADAWATPGPGPRPRRRPRCCPAARPRPLRSPPRPGS